MASHKHSRVPTRILLKLNFTKPLMERFLQATLIKFKISILCINEVTIGPLVMSWLSRYVTFDLKQKTFKVFFNGQCKLGYDMLSFEGLFCICCLLALYQDCRHVAKPGGKKSS